MSLIIDALVNLWRLIRNARARLLAQAAGVRVDRGQGPLAEFETPVGFLRRRLSRGPSPPTLERMRAMARQHRRRRRVRAASCCASGTSMPGGRPSRSCDGEILAFRARGGRVVAYLADPADTRSYYLACAADEILATPLADLNVTGIRARVDFLKDALEQSRRRGRGRRRLALQVSGRAVRPQRLLPRVPRAGRASPRPPLRGGGTMRSPTAGASPPKRCAPR